MEFFQHPGASAQHHAIGLDIEPRKPEVVEELIRRDQIGEWSEHTDGGPGGAPGWVRLVRRGNTVEAFRSNDGLTWTSMGSTELVIDGQVYVGLAVTRTDQVPKLVEEMQQAGVTTLKMYVGTSREIVTFQMNRLRRMGLLTYSRKFIDINGAAIQQLLRDQGIISVQTSAAAGNVASYIGR